MERKLSHKIETEPALMQLHKHSDVLGAHRPISEDTAHLRRQLGACRSATTRCNPVHEETGPGARDLLKWCARSTVSYSQSELRSSELKELAVVGSGEVAGDQYGLRKCWQAEDGDDEVLEGINRYEEVDRVAERMGDVEEEEQREEPAEYSPNALHSDQDLLAFRHAVKRCTQSKLQNRYGDVAFERSVIRPPM